MMNLREAKKCLVGEVVRVKKVAKSGLVLADTTTKVMGVGLFAKQFTAPGLVYYISTPSNYKIHVWDGMEIDTQITVLETIALGKFDQFQAEGRLKNQRIYVYRPERKSADGKIVYEHPIDRALTVREISGSIVEDDIPTDLAYYLKYSDSRECNKEIMIWNFEVDNSTIAAIIEPANIIHMPYEQAKQELVGKKIRVGWLVGVVECIYLGRGDGRESADPKPGFPYHLLLEGGALMRVQSYDDVEILGRFQ